MNVRILVVDDSAVVRRLVSDVLNAESDLEVVATAPTGTVGLTKLERFEPDVVVLDVEMPGMSGLEVLSEIRRRDGKIPIIMFSSLTERAASTTLEALSRGATAYAAKPSGTRSLEEGLEKVREALVPVVRAVCGQDVRPAAPVPKRAPRPIVRSGNQPAVLAIGCSTGGPNALVEVIGRFPKNLPVPIVIVQHMPPLFTKILADRLTANSNVTVHEAVHGDVLKPGEAWIAPGDYHMQVVREAACVRVMLDQSPPENSCRPAVDVLFRSVAAVYGSSIVAAVLTGMGYDGLRGCEVIGAAGGYIAAQDEATSVVWGMPGAIVQAGLADAVLPLSDIGDHLVGRVLHGGTKNDYQGGTRPWLTTAN